MAINPISAMSFKGLWEVNTINPRQYRGNHIQKNFVYHPFADEKVDTVDLEAKKKMVSGVYSYFLIYNSSTYSSILSFNL